jgi:aminopeptidase N
MENTTATLHQEGAQQDARELTDGNRWEEVIAHELFHQWFGDYVTAESWSNLPLNESFATLGSQLWNEYKYGRDAGDAERYSSRRVTCKAAAKKSTLSALVTRIKKICSTPLVTTRAAPSCKCCAIMLATVPFTNPSTCT